MEDLMLEDQKIILDRKETRYHLPSNRRKPLKEFLIPLISLLLGWNVFHTENTAMLVTRFVLVSTESNFMSSLHYTVAFHMVIVLTTFLL